MISINKNLIDVEFKNYLKNNTKLCNSSIKQYTDCMKKILEWLGVHTHIYNQTDLNQFIDRIQNNNTYIERIKRDHGNFKSAIKYFKIFVNSII